jgi:hypothetical protein
VLTPAVTLPKEPLTVGAPGWPLTELDHVLALKVDAVPPDPVKLPKLLVLAVDTPKAEEGQPKTLRLI